MAVLEPACCVCVCLLVYVGARAVAVDKLIHYVNLDGRINAFYSTPAIFADALKASNVTFTTKVGRGNTA